MTFSNLLSFNHLKAKGVVDNRTQLSRLIKTQNFPEGFLLSVNARRWTEEEIGEWIETRRGSSVREVE
jgi:hypothetical protein